MNNYLMKPMLMECTPQTTVHPSDSVLNINTLK